jgi:molecular chaperone HscB
MTKLTCWNCNTQISEQDLFCPACAKILPPAQIDHFARMNMPCDFDLGMKKLEVAYFSLQTKLHPDRFAQKTEKEKMFSMQQSMSANEAYEVLKNPLLRAEYILKLAGVVVNSNNATVKPSQEILIESMETRERLAEASSAEEIRQITIETMEARLSAIDSIKQHVIDGKLEDAAQETIKLRYLEKLNEEIKQVAGIRF